MKLAVFTVMLPDLTPEEAAQELKVAGYDGVEWRVTRTPEERGNEALSFWGNNLCTFEPTAAEAGRARALVESAGLAIPNLGTYIAVGDLAATEEGMRFAQTVGSPQIRVGVGGVEETSYTQQFAEAKTFLSEVTVLARRYAVKALIEIHHRSICSSASLAHRLASHFDPEWIGVIFDPGNMVYEGYEDYRIGLELLGPYLAHVHLKNGAFTRPDEGGVWAANAAPLEDGVVDFTSLFTALRSIGYDGWLGIEDFSGVRPTREALRFNHDFIRDAITSSP